MFGYLKKLKRLSENSPFNSLNPIMVSFTFYNVPYISDPVDENSASELGLKPGRLGRHQKSRIRNAEKLSY